MDTRHRFETAKVAAARREQARQPIVDHALEQAGQLVEQCQRSGLLVPAWWPGLAPLTRLEREHVRRAVVALLAREATA